MKENKIVTLFLVQLPGAIHGSSIIGKNLIEKVSGIHDKVIPINLSLSNDDINKLSLRKILLMLRQIYSVFKIRNEIDQYVLAYTASGLIFYRDLILVLILRKKRKMLLMNNKGVLKFGRIKKFLAQAFFRESELIVNSMYLISDFDSLNISRINFVEIPNSDFNEEKREYIPRDFKSINALYLSNIYRSKGVFETIEICKNISRLTGLKLDLKICGLLVDVTMEELQNKMDEVKEDISVRYLGAVYGQKKKEFLESSDVFFLPTRYPKECFPVSIIEALACSSLVVTTNEGGIRTIIQDGYNGYLIDTENINSDIERIVSSYSNWHIIAQNAHSSYKEFFTTEKWINNWKSLLLNKS